jgi:subtilisin family serine protease
MRRVTALALAGLLALVGGVAEARGAERPDEPIDPLYAESVRTGGWLERIGWSWSPLADAIAADRAFPTIAVIDSGVDVSHPEFAGGVVDLHSADCASGARPVRASESLGNVADQDGHGTVVSALAAGPANGEGLVGVSPESSVLMVRVRTDPLGGVDCALTWLGDYAARSSSLLVVNLSLDDRDTTARRRGRIARLVSAGALVVAATGNGGPGKPIGSPARLPHVLAVGDAERQERRAGPQLDLLAPGAGFRVPEAGSSQWEPVVRPFTSWASAVVSGAAALVWGLRRDELTAQQVAWLLRRGASGRGRWRPGDGFGGLSVSGALALRRVPADDEFEVNDTPRSAWTSGAAPSGCRSTSCDGLAGTTDDPQDWWPVARRRTRTHACVTATKGSVRLAWKRTATGLSVGVVARRPLVSYRLRLRATPCTGASASSVLPAR